MIEYKDEYLNVFRPYSGDSYVLNYIKGISISASGSTEADTNSGAPYAKLVSINSGTTSVTLDIEIFIPILGISTVITTEELYKSQGLIVSVSHNIPLGLGVITTNADILLKSFSINTFREISLFGNPPSRIIKLADGYNTRVSVQGNTLYIEGGSGLGKGMYYGPSDDLTKNKYEGIKSINGIRSSRNVDIEMSDLLIENGAYVL